MFKVSKTIKVQKSVDEVWNVISSPGHLNNFHPFCKENKVMECNNNIILKDQLIYLNDLNYYRTFTKWQPKIGYSLKIGSENAKQSDVKWEIINNFEFTCVKITVRPYVSNKIPKLLYPFFHFALIRPKLGSYLSSVLKGLEYFLVENKKVSFNQFGSHSWFS